jgi:hypothetical protein
VMIGCLTDSARPALVLDWCSRGSLEDVLVRDEIKLDWSFRLSLLTDLVRVSTPSEVNLVPYHKACWCSGEALKLFKGRSWL